MRTVPLKHLARIAVSNVDKKTASDERPIRLCNYTDVYYNERITANLPFMEATASADQIERFGLRAGDILLTKDSETPDDIAVPAYVVADLPGVVCGYHLALLRPRQEVDGRYLFWALTSRLSREQFSASANGITRFGLRYDSFGEVRVPLPRLACQRAIADYLDRETARIDALIEKKGRLLTLLDERWIVDVADRLSPTWAVEHVLHGRSVRIPNDWQLRKLGSLTKPNAPIAYGILLPGPRLDDGVPYVGAGEVKLDRLNLDTLPRTAPTIAAAYPRTKMRAGELVYAIRGSFGAIEQIPPDLDGVNLSRDAARVAPGPEVDARWLMYALKSEVCQEQFQRREVGATITGINIEDLKSVQLAVPDRKRQMEDVAYLDARLRLYQELRADLGRQLALLNEHREGLITAAVTGELEIPGVAA